MELKVIASPAHVVQQCTPVESNKWNWKFNCINLFNLLKLVYFLYQESNKWNWKIILKSLVNALDLLLNPINGIESSSWGPLHALMEMRESNKWNWKLCLKHSSLLELRLGLESNKWNWKICVPSWPWGTPKREGNPINGIESFAPLGSSFENLVVGNPINGIESYENHNSTPRKSCRKNPINGIESIDYVDERLGMLVKRIQ